MQYKNWKYFETEDWNGSDSRNYHFETSNRRVRATNQNLCVYLQTLWIKKYIINYKNFLWHVCYDSKYARVKSVLKFGTYNSVTLLKFQKSPLEILVKLFLSKRLQKKNNRKTSGISLVSLKEKKVFPWLREYIFCHFCTLNDSSYSHVFYQFFSYLISLRSSPAAGLFYYPILS